MNSKLIVGETEDQRPYTIDYIYTIRKALMFDAEYQRDYVANTNKRWQQDLIRTILSGGILPLIYLRRNIDDKGNVIYEVVDGQQRLRTLIDFIDGKFKSPSFEISDQYGSRNFGNILYDELRAKEYDWLTDIFLNHTLAMVEVEGTDWEMADLFFKLNNLNDMKAQEIRNCTRSDLAAWVRSTSRGITSRGFNYNGSIHPLLEVNNNKGVYVNFTPARQSYDELLTQLLIYEEDISNGIARGVLDKLYYESVFKHTYGIADTMVEGLKNPTSIADTKPLGKIVKTNLDTIFKLLKTGNYRKYMVRNVLYNLYMVVTELRRASVQIKDYDKFIKYFMDIHIKEKTLPNWMKQLGMGETPYSNLTRLGKTEEHLKLRTDYFLKPLVDDPDVAGVVIKDPKRVVSDEDLYERWRKVGEVCELCEESLSYADAVKGHDIPHSHGIKKGGVSTKKNLRVLHNECNQKMGDTAFSKYKKTIFPTP
tara:strand:+ start:1405 stop:2844 length:1440 start_codon:yes stop_codon:yes gene_type:complete